MAGAGLAVLVAPNKRRHWPAAQRHARARNVFRFSTLRYTTGTTISDSSVELITPPMTAIAMGARNRGRDHRDGMNEALELRSQHDVDEDQTQPERDRHGRVVLVHEAQLPVVEDGHARRELQLGDLRLELGRDITQRTADGRRP